MGYRDIELLAAISGNQVKFRQVFDRLQQKANSIALALFSDATLRAEAVEKAMNKISDWLRSDAPLHTDYPWSYAKRVIANSLFDCAKTRKMEGVGLNARVGYGKSGNTIRQEMAWIDESFARLDDEAGADSAGGTGWRVFQIIETQPTRNESDDRYHAHRWVEGLNQLFHFQWWWGFGVWADKIQGERKRRGQSWRGSGSEAALRCTEYSEKRWSRYNLIMALVDSIPGRSEQRVVQHFLWGFKAVEITNELRVSKPYVSKVLNRWLRAWGWADSDLYQAKLILLTKQLADWWLDTIETVPATSTLRELDARWGRIRDPESWEYYDLEDSFSDEVRKLDRKRNLTEDGFYQRVIGAPQTRIYFSDLSKWDNKALLDTAANFSNRWSPNVRFRGGRYYLVGSQAVW